jgi:hypothetical protein
MTPRVLMADGAVDRLTELDLSIDLVERVVRQADAEASFCTPLDPPIMEGLTRWARTNRFLREELIPLGWRFDNPRNLPRTIYPGGRITSWAERIILPVFPRGDVPLMDGLASPDAAGDRGIVVEVSRL